MRFRTGLELLTLLNCLSLFILEVIPEENMLNATHPAASDEEYFMKLPLKSDYRDLQ